MRVLGIAALILLAPLVLLMMTEPPTASGAAYVLGLVVVAVGFVVRKPWSRRLFALGGVLIAVTLVLRLALSKGRYINRVVAEEDVVINASRALGWTHALSDPDVPLLPDAMRSAYHEMNGSAALASPIASTLLGLERPGSSETLEVGGSDRHAVVFLHGSAGNYAMSCWLFARAAIRAHMTTVCPSTRWTGDWWSHDGEAIVRETMASLRARGFTRLFLAGLSNGAIGASRLAPKLAGDIAGLVLVSGAAPDATPSPVPTLVVQGRDDRQISAAVSHGYALRTGAKYVELPAGHFALLIDRDAASAAISEWLSGR